MMAWIFAATTLLCLCKWLARAEESGELRRELDIEKSKRLSYGDHHALSGKVTYIQKFADGSVKYTVKSAFSRYREVELPVALGIGDEVGVFIGINRAEKTEVSNG